MRDVSIVGVGMHPFGKHRGKDLKAMGAEAVWAAVRDAAVDPRRIGVAYVGNSLGGLLTGQEGIRGQVVLQEAGIGGIPIINVENACASAATALRGAWLEVASGEADIALALGVEKMFIGDTARSMKALAADSEIELSELGMQFVAVYAVHPKYNLKAKMREYGWTPEDFARVVVKNARHGALNEYAHFRKETTVEEVLSSPMIADPITRNMCSPMSDGAAAAILVATDLAERLSERKPIRIAGIALRSARYQATTESEEDSLTATAQVAYEAAGIGPEDIDIAEVHDAMAPAEMLAYEKLGFCGPGEGAAMVRNGTTSLAGALPVNTSGGLVAKGHPVGATGLAQVAEIVWQLRGEAGARQATGEPRVGLTQNLGGLLIGMDSAATYSVAILCR